jgi:hypothetical protein
MNITLIGKILVVATVVLSLMVAAFAVGIYTNRIDWPGTASAPGEYTKRKTEVDEAQKAAGIALARLEDASKDLAQLEARIPKDQEFYADKLTILQEGQDKAGAPQPVQVFTAGRPDELGLPMLQWKAPANPLLSRRQALEELKRLNGEIVKEHDAIKGVIARQEEQTLEINGIAGKQKGLRDLVAEEDRTRKNALAEMEVLRPLRYNREVESELLATRQGVLEARLRELQKIGMAVGQP